MVHRERGRGRPSGGFEPVCAALIPCSDPCGYADADVSPIGYSERFSQLLPEQLNAYQVSHNNAY